MSDAEGEPLRPDPDYADDQTITARAVRGHRPSFEALVHRTARLVWSQIALRVGAVDRSLIDDLVQETYLRAWRNIHTLDSPARFRPWLIAIAQRVRLDEHKHRSRRKRQGPSSNTEPDDSPAPTVASSPEQQATLNEEKSRAIEAMQALPDQYRDVLALRYLSDADTSEIARQLALTTGSVRGLLHRGLELLRDQLREPSPITPRPTPAAMSAGGVL